MWSEKNKPSLYLANSQDTFIIRSQGSQMNPHSECFENQWRWAMMHRVTQCLLFKSKRQVNSQLVLQMKPRTFSHSWNSACEIQPTKVLEDAQGTTGTRSFLHRWPTCPLFYSFTRADIKHWIWDVTKSRGYLPTRSRSNQKACSPVREADMDWLTWCSPSVHSFIHSFLYPPTRIESYKVALYSGHAILFSVHIF